MKDFQTWNEEREAKVAILKEAIDMLDNCEMVWHAKASLRMLHDSYAVSSWPGGLRKDESTDHQL